MFTKDQVSEQTYISNVFAAINNFEELIQEQLHDPDKLMGHTTQVCRIGVRVAASYLIGKRMISYYLDAPEWKKDTLLPYVIGCEAHKSKIDGGFIITANIDDTYFMSTLTGAVYPLAERADGIGYAPSEEEMKKHTNKELLEVEMVGRTSVCFVDFIAMNNLAFRNVDLATLSYLYGSLIAYEGIDPEYTLQNYFRLAEASASEVRHSLPECVDETILFLKTPTGNPYSLYKDNKRNKDTA